MFEMGEYPTLGYSITQPEMKPYTGDDLDPVEVNYTICHLDGFGLFVQSNYDPDHAIRLDFMKGVPRSWNFFGRRQRQYPIYIPGGKPWHTGKRDSYWGIVELSEKIPGHVAYPLIYELLEFLNTANFMWTQDNISTIQTIREVYAGNGSLEKVHVGEITFPDNQEPEHNQQDQTKRDRADVLVEDKTGGSETTLFGDSKEGWVSSTGSLLEEDQYGAGDGTSSEELESYSSEVNVSGVDSVEEVLNNSVNRGIDEDSDW